MNEKQRKDRIRYLWGRVRILVHQKGMLKEVLKEKISLQREKFGLQSESSLEMNSDIEMEVEDDFDEKKTSLPWYLFDEDNTFPLF